MLEEYQELNQTEKENFARIFNILLGKTYINNKVYDDKVEKTSFNRDYRFIESNIVLFSNVAEMIGFKLNLDSDIEVISLTNSYEYNKKTFNKNTTNFLVLLRLMYDEEREKLKLTREVVVKVSDITNKYLEVGISNKRPTLEDINSALSELIRFNIIEKLDTNLKNPETRIMIYPSILIAVSNEKVRKIIEYIPKDKELEEDSENEEE